MEEKSVKVDGHNIRYLIDGKSKKNLLLIHGLGASAERWEHVIPNFAKNYRVIVPDLIGCGQSDKPTIDYTTHYLSQFIKKFLDHIALITKANHEIIHTVVRISLHDMPKDRQTAN